MKFRSFGQTVSPGSVSQKAEPESTFLFAIYAKGTLPFRLRVDGLLFAETE